MKSNYISIFRLIGILVITSIQAMGQNPDSLTSNNWIEKQLRLGDITQSSAEVDLRIFIDRGITNVGHVIYMVKEKKGWAGMKYDYALKMNDGRVSETIARITRTKLKSDNWDSLWIALQRYHILLLPNQVSIKDKLRKKIPNDHAPGYEAYEIMIVTDGTSYDLAIKKDGKIVSYSFQDPCIYSKKYPDVEEVKDYCGILSALESEFHIEL